MDQMEAIGTTFDDVLEIGIRGGSIKVQELMPVVDAIKKVNDKDVKLEKESNRRFKEINNVKSSGKKNRGNIANICCDICGKKVIIHLNAV